MTVPAAAGRDKPACSRARPGQIALALAIAAFLVAVPGVPVGDRDLCRLHREGRRRLHAGQFPRLRRAPTCSCARSGTRSMSRRMTVVGASLLALPLAYLTTRFEFRGAALIQTLGFLPLIMPPFVGAVAMQLLFGRNGTVNLLLDDWFGFKIALHGRAERRHLRAGDPLFPVHPDQSVGGAAQHRPRDGGGGAEPRRRPASACSAASCFRWRCRATSPARRWCSSRCSTTWPRRCCSTSRTCWRRRPICASPRSASTIRWAT